VGASREGSAFELTEARAILEGEAAALAARMITPQQLNALKQALTELEAEYQNGEPLSERADEDFHQIIADATHNPLIVEMVEDLWRTRNNTPSIRHAYQENCKTDSMARYKEHEAIFMAIRAGDAAAARQAMHHHFETILSTLISAQEAAEFEALKSKTLASRERFSLKQLKARG
jgi:DNA-binding FadR family transcriptional regulator